MAVPSMRPCNPALTIAIPVQTALGTLQADPVRPAFTRNQSLTPSRFRKPILPEAGFPDFPAPGVPNRIPETVPTTKPPRSPSGTPPLIAGGMPLRTATQHSPGSGVSGSGNHLWHIWLRDKLFLGIPSARAKPPGSDPQPNRRPRQGTTQRQCSRTNHCIAPVVPGDSSGSDSRVSPLWTPTGAGSGF
jgi:hypothetical protein